MTNFELVKNFHLIFRRPIRNEPTVLPKKDGLMRVDLVFEEAEELEDAIARNDLVAIADALADLLYVTYGTAVEMGIDVDRVFAEVHRSNMTKLGQDGKPILRSDGKVLKGPGYEPPNIKEVM